MSDVTILNQRYGSFTLITPERNDIVIGCVPLVSVVDLRPLKLSASFSHVIPCPETGELWLDVTPGVNSHDVPYVLPGFVRVVGVGFCFDRFDAGYSLDVLSFDGVSFSQILSVGVDARIGEWSGYTTWVDGALAVRVSGGGVSDWDRLVVNLVLECQSVAAVVPPGDGLSLGDGSVLTIGDGTFLEV